MASDLLLQSFVLWAPDYEDPDTITKRLSVREVHLKHAREMAKEGINRLGGHFYSSDATTAGESQKIVGTLMILRAESLEAARKHVEEDINYTSGVWDKERLQILPVYVGTLQPPIGPGA